MQTGGMDCLVVIASLCFSNVQSVEVSRPSTISRWATARVLGSEVLVQLSGDSLRGEYDTSRMSRACIDGSCVTYHRWCESRDEGWTCYYSTEENANYSRWLRITAPDTFSYATVEKSLGLIGAAGVVIPLSELNTVSNELYPPFCRRGGRGPQCPE